MSPAAEAAIITGTFIAGAAFISGVFQLLGWARKRNGNGNPATVHQLSQAMHERFDQQVEIANKALRELTTIKTIIDERLPRR